jgi:uncharacterized membrane protein (DUF485 family)
VSTTPVGRSSGTSYEEVQASEEFVQLRKSFRRFVFPVSAFFLTWYFAYVLLAAYARDFMSTKLVGNINVGLVLGLLAITMIYARWADRQFDPTAESLRDHIESGELK